VTTLDVGNANANPNPGSASAHPAGWYADPWAIAPWRWWDGAQWTPILYGPYGEAWPLAMAAAATAAPAPFVAKGPGIQGGGIAAAGAGIGVAVSIVVAIVFLIASAGQLHTNNPWLLLASQVGLWVGFVGAVVVASRRHGTRSLARDFGLSRPTVRDLWTGVAGGLLGRLLPLLLLVVIVVASHSDFGSPNGASPRVLGTTPSGVAGWAVVIVLGVIGAPLVEELFFRGLLQGAFTRRLGAVPAIFITALIFSFAHITSEGILAPVILFPMALVLGYLKHKTGRLAAGMVAHVTFNASLFLLFLVPAVR
jgi:membrane protease YdiL (CAAX protease family)